MGKSWYTGLQSPVGYNVVFFSYIVRPDYFLWWWFDRCFLKTCFGENSYVFRDAVTCCYDNMILLVFDPQILDEMFAVFSHSHASPWLCLHHAPDLGQVYDY